MNTGMQDAFNLAWKLALVHHGKARREILSSYTQERSEVGEMVLRNAGIFTRVATLRNPVLRFMRNHLMAFAGKLDAVQERAIAALSELDIHYPNSPLNCDDHGDAWDKTMQVGDRLPDANMRCSHNKPIRLLDAIRGPGYTLLLLPESGDLATVDGMATSARHVTRQYAGLVKSVVVLPGETKEFNQLADISIVLVDAEREFRKRLGLQGSALALVRPDGYLAFRGDAGSWSKLGEYFAKWLIATDAEHELQTAGGQRTPEFCQ